jgi:hypothetical protein
LVSFIFCSPDFTAGFIASRRGADGSAGPIAWPGLGKDGATPRESRCRHRRFPTDCERSRASDRFILAAWAEQKAVREIMVFLHSHGVGTARAVRISKTYGADAIQVMTENPYRLARDIRGIGFKTADTIAMKLGVEPLDVCRAQSVHAASCGTGESCRPDGHRVLANCASGLTFSTMTLT